MTSRPGLLSNSTVISSMDDRSSRSPRSILHQNSACMRRLHSTYGCEPGTVHTYSRSKFIRRQYQLVILTRIDWLCADFLVCRYSGGQVCSAAKPCDIGLRSASCLVQDCRIIYCTDDHNSSQISDASSCKAACTLPASKSVSIRRSLAIFAKRATDFLSLPGDRFTPLAGSQDSANWLLW
jgi:hypothetical protein